VRVTPPTSPTMLDQVEIKKQQGLSGDQFDQEYIKTMVKAHEADLKDFQKEANSGTSSAVKTAASEGTDVISNHLSMIRQIAAYGALRQFARILGRDQDARLLEQTFREEELASQKLSTIAERVYPSAQRAA
jgi:hypothetical protein